MRSKRQTLAAIDFGFINTHILMKFLHFLARKSIDRKCLNSQLIRTGFANHMRSLSDDITRGHCQRTRGEICHDHDFGKAKKSNFFSFERS